MPMSLYSFLVLEKFETSMADPRNLVAIHRELERGPGRRTREIALNRAVVVLTVAAWQSLVQDLVKNRIDEMRPPAGDPAGAYQILRAQALIAINIFATPNAEKSKDLLLHVGVDPWQIWRVRFGPVTLAPAEVRTRLNQWLKVRHAVAHGDAFPSVSVLSVTRGGNPTLRLKDAERCIRFFEALGRLTAEHVGSLEPHAIP
jgi:RiboL-PSP-HEPN